MNTEEQEILAVEHEEWLQHPVTKSMLRCLDKQKETYVNALSNAAFNTTSEEQAKRAVALNTIINVKNWISKTVTFVELNNKK